MDEYPTPPARRMLGRALRRRCPLCGGSGLFSAWVEPEETCPRCGLSLDRGESDFFLGAYTLNFIAVELMLVAFLATGVLLTWPDVPWTTLVWVGAPLMIALPILVYPVARMTWLAVDLAMRPPGPDDFPAPDAESEPRVS